MKWLVLVLVVLAVCVGCGNDQTRLDRQRVEGVECIVVRDGAHRAIAIDCDWGKQ